MPKKKEEKPIYACEECNERRFVSGTEMVRASRPKCLACGSVRLNRVKMTRPKLVFRDEDATELFHAFKNRGDSELRQRVAKFLRRVDAAKLRSTPSAYWYAEGPAEPEPEYAWIQDSQGINYRIYKSPGVEGRYCHEWKDVVSDEWRFRGAVVGCKDLDDAIEKTKKRLP